MNKYTILKLKNLNLEELLKQFPPKLGELTIKDFNVDFAYLLIHFVLQQMANRIENNDFKIKSYSSTLFSIVFFEIKQSLKDNFSMLVSLRIFVRSNILKYCALKLQ